MAQDRPTPAPRLKRASPWPLRLTALAIVAVLAFLWIGPRYIDWTPLKADLSELLSRQFGMEVEISGGLRLELLPRPRLTAADVHLDGEETTGNIRWLRGSLDPLALLTGTLVPRDLEVVEAALTLPFDLGGVEALATTSAIRIENGTLRLTRTPDWFPKRLERVNGTLVLGGGLGRSFAFDGDARVLDEPVGLSVEGRSGGRLVLGLAHGPSAADLALEGQPDEFGSWRGRATLVLEEAAFLSTLRMEEMARLLGEGPAVIDLRIQALPGGTLVSVVDSIDATRMSGSGVATVSPGDRTSVDIDLNLGRLEFERSGTGSVDRLLTDAVRALEDLSEVDITLAASAQRIELDDSTLRGAEVALSAGGGVAVVDRFSVALPQQTEAQFSGTLAVDPDVRWRLEGPFELRTANIRALLDWAGVPLAENLSEVPAGRLEQTRFHADLTLEPRRLGFNNMVVVVDDSTWAGTFVRHTGNNDEDPGAISLVLQGDRLNLDRYLPEDWSWTGDWLLSPLSRDVLIYLDRATLFGVPTDGLILGLNAEAGSLPTLDLALLNLAGADGSIDMRLDSNESGTPSASASATLNIPDPDVFLGALGMPARQAARFAGFGKTDLRLDISYAPEQGVGYAFQATGLDSEASFNGTASFGSETRISISDGIAQTPNWSFERIAGECVSVEENEATGWSCPQLSGRYGIFELNGAASLTEGPDRQRQIDIEAIGTAVDIGAAIADTGLPLLPEGTAQLNGELSGSGTSWETALSDLSGMLELSGEAQISIRQTDSAVGNVQRLRRQLNDAFAEPGALNGRITVTPQTLSAAVTLSGDHARALGEAVLIRSTDMLRATVNVMESGNDRPALNLEADGPSGDPDMRLSGRWISGN